MKHSIQVGVSFGLTSGVITPLGLMVGLAAGTHSSVAVIGGVATIALADALSDALGIHIAEEAEQVHTPAQVWVATASTAVSKAATAGSFLVPLALLPLEQAVWAGLAWGALLIVGLSYLVGRDQQVKTRWVIVEHLVVAGVVVLASHGIGRGVAAVMAGG